MSSSRLNRFFIALTFTVLILPMAAGAADRTGDVSAPQTKGGLFCFSVEPIKADPKIKHEDYPSCDALCAKQGAVCAGMQNGGLNPPVTCADHTSSTWAVCRCCKVQQ